MNHDRDFRYRPYESSVSARSRIATALASIAVSVTVLGGVLGEALDAAGNLLSDWSAMSATSGFDCRFVAPEAVDPGAILEPEPFFLFGAAFVALQVARRAGSVFGGPRGPRLVGAAPS